MLRKAEILFEKRACTPACFFVYYNDLGVGSAEFIPVGNSPGIEIDDLLFAEPADWIACMGNEGNAVQGKGRKGQLAGFIVP